VLALIEICFSEELVSHQSVSQSRIPLNKSFLKCHTNFLKAFGIDLKVFLGLVLPILPHFHLGNWGWFLDEAF